MSSYLALTTTQKVRAFLNVLQADPAPTATSRDVIKLLTARVRERRDDPEARLALQNLLADLARDDAAALPAPQCETQDALALAAELAWLLNDGNAISLKTKPRVAASLLAAAVLLCGLTMSWGCIGADGDRSIAELADCVADPSTEHFNEILEQTGELTSTQIVDATSEFDAHGQSARQDVLINLCGMSAEEIAAYIEDGFRQDINNSSGDNTDGAMLYKGVTFD
jgi:hypothetical protein